MAPSNIKYSAAIRRSKTYVYTPTYIFKNKDIYHLVFNNPTQKDLKIEIMGINSLNNKKMLFKLFLKPMGTNYLRVNKFEGKLSFYSKLPICRCIIFKNPEDLINNENYDVFSFLNKILNDKIIKKFSKAKKNLLKAYIIEGIKKLLSINKRKHFWLLVLQDLLERH